MSKFGAARADARLAGEAEEEFARITQAVQVDVYEDGNGVFRCPLRTARDAENALRNRSKSKFKTAVDTSDGLFLVLDTKAARASTAALLFALTAFATAVALGWMLRARIVS